MKTQVDFVVVPSQGIKVSWIAVGNKDVALTNDAGSILLEAGRKHILQWWMLGNSGDSISITGKSADGEPVVEVAKSSIPTGEPEGGGLRRFWLS